RVVEALERKREMTTRQFSNVYDRIIFPTTSFRDFFARSVPLPASRTTVVSPGVELDRPVVHSHDRFGAVLDLVFIGGGEPRKGRDLLIEAFCSSELTDRDDYRLRILGGGEVDVWAGLLAANPRAAHRGRFTNEQLPDVLAGAAVGLSPSYF